MGENRISIRLNDYYYCYYRRVRIKEKFRLSYAIQIICNQSQDILEEKRFWKSLCES